MPEARRNVILLALCQALYLTAAIVVMTAGGLVGHALALDKSLATLPIAASVVGTALATVPASFLMRRKGRRFGFIVGALAGAGGAAVAAVAIGRADFLLFCLGHLLIGAYQAFAQYYRFAAADTASPAFRARAISLVLAGGVAAAFLGPQLARWTKDWGAGEAFLGSYWALAVLGVVAAAILGLVRIPRPAADAQAASGRPLGEFARQPVFLVAVAGAAIGYGVMILAMTATPLAMVSHHHAVDDAAQVIQWHVVGMFAPSFFTGALIGRFGVLNVMFAGAVLLAGHVAIAVSGIEFLNFVSALVLLGIGWNFLYVGGSTLLAEAHDAAERAKVQAANEFTIFGVVTVASFSAGSLLHHAGWAAVNLAALPFLALAGMAVLWLAARRRRTAGG